MMMFVLGIDEAGRGPVLGPMVVAGVAIETEKEAHLKKLGVTDSKALSPQRREALAIEIRKAAKGIESVAISAKQLDEMMQIMTINQIEMNAMALIINKLPADEVYIDLPSNGPAFLRELKAKITRSPAKIIAEHKADANYTVVGAASIIAKTERDSHIEELQKKYSAYGDIGSGYPADERTITFLEKYYSEHKSLPPEARKSWSTASDIMKKDKQRKLV